jgi:hypothetical protein
MACSALSLSPANANHGDPASDIANVPCLYDPPTESCEYGSMPADYDSNSSSFHLDVTEDNGKAGLCDNGFEGGASGASAFRFTAKIGDQVDLRVEDDLGGVGLCAVRLYRESLPGAPQELSSLYDDPTREQHSVVPQSGDLGCPGGTSVCTMKWTALPQTDTYYLVFWPSNGDPHYAQFKFRIQVRPCSGSSCDGTNPGSSGDPLGATPCLYDPPRDPCDYGSVPDDYTSNAASHHLDVTKDNGKAGLCDNGFEGGASGASAFRLAAKIGDQVDLKVQDDLGGVGLCGVRLYRSTLPGATQPLSSLYNDPTREDHSVVPQSGDLGCPGETSVCTVKWTSLPQTDTYYLVFWPSNGDPHYAQFKFRVIVGTAPPMITVPSSLTGVVEARFPGHVRGIFGNNFALRVTGTTSNLSTFLTCYDGATVVGCNDGPATRATLRPSRPLVPGQRYTAIINPPGASPITDSDAAACPTTTRDFRASTVEQESSVAAAYRWRTASVSSAYGGSFVAQRLAGATAAFRFDGTSITMYAVAGPAYGLADAYIDGTRRVTWNFYSSSTRYKVGRALTGLANTSHTIKIVVRGVKGSSSGTDTQVAVDAFKVGSYFYATPTLVMSWQARSASSASAGRYARADLAGASVSISFRGTGIDWYTVLGPSMGKAQLWVDGSLNATVDNYSAATAYGVRRSLRGLADRIHVLRIVVLGQKRSASTGNFIAIDRWLIV